MSEDTAIEKGQFSIEQAAAEVGDLAKECNPVALRALPVLQQTIKLAKGIHRMRQLLNDKLMDAVFMPLQGTPVGFFTDSSDNKPIVYPREVVREVVITGMMYGLRPIGGEMGIISGKCYAAKPGLERLVREWDGLTDLVVTPGVPQSNGADQALIEMRADWRLHGKPMCLFRGVSKEEDGTVRDTRFAIRVNRGMGPDAVIGKATRKLYRAVLDLLSGASFSALGDGDPFDTTGEVVSEPRPPIAPPEQDGKRMKLGKQPPPQASEGTHSMREPVED